ncbi:MAG: hypothetical protein JXQ76_10860 [Campylobacterales bacterium]|nr:hypothetical protein [Campylobacterales bacterium]
MKRAIVFLISGFFLLFSMSVLFFEPKIIASVLMGYATASLVLVASMRSYARFVQKGLANYIPIDESDTIDKVEDPYHLFDDEPINEERSEEEIVDVVKEERARLKGRSFVEILKDSRASLAPYRILSYTLMIVGFVFLQRNALLAIFPYLLALTLPIIITVATFVLFEEDIQ